MPDKRKKHKAVCMMAALSMTLLLLIASFTVPLQARAQAFPLGVFIVSEALFSVEEKTVYVLCGATVTNLEALRVMLRDGAQLQLSGAFSFHRSRGAWFDAKIADGEFSTIIRYNQLTQEFEVIVPEETMPLFKHKRLESVLAKTWHQFRLPLAEANTLKDAENYYVQIKLSLRHTDVPPWVTKGLLFWSWEVVPDKTVRYRFSLTAAQEAF